MLKCLTRLWHRIKSPFVREPLPPPPPLRPDFSDLEYENLFMGLLEKVDQGNSWGRLQGFLIANKVDKGRLAQWLRRFGEGWLAQPEVHQELAQRLMLLGQVATGELGEVASRLGERLSISEEMVSDSPISEPAGVQGPEGLGEKQTEAVEEDDQGVQALIDQMVRQLQAGDYQGALDSVIRATEMYPNDHRGWGARGELMLIFQQYEEAIASFDQALKLKPDLLEAWGNRGNALENLGRKEEALASYDQVLKLKPDDHQAWGNRGNALGNLGRKEEALVSYDQALKLKPDYHQAWFNRGNALDDLGRTEEALASFDQALKVKPDFHEAWCNRGWALDNLGRTEEALASFDQALKVKPDFHEAWNSRGIALGNLGRYEEALASFDQALKVKPDFHEAWGNRGLALDHLGCYEEALASFDQVLKLKPDNHVAWVNRGLAAEGSSGYDPYLQQQFVGLFRLEASNAPQQLITTDQDRCLTQFQTSLIASTTQLQADFANLDAPQLIAQIQQPSPPELSQLIQQPPPPQLIALIQQPLSETVAKQLEQDSFSHPPRLNPHLNQRGYEGQLASYQAELDKAIRKDTHPQGWGSLHHRIGQAHYFRGQRDANPSSFWHKAKASYKTALQTLKPPKFEELHLEVLRDLIRVLLDLREIDEARELQRQGVDLLRRMLADPKRTQRNKRELVFKSAVFDQLTVDLVLQSGNILEALTLAETGKNTCLRWLLDTGEIPMVTYAQIQQLLNSTTAVGSIPFWLIYFFRWAVESGLYSLMRYTLSKMGCSPAVIYWHLSPSALTGFVILPDEPAPIVVESKLAEAQVNKREEQRPASLLQVLAWEKWLSDWNQQYEAYNSPKGRKKTAKAGKGRKKEHSWRTEMEQRLESLKQILNVPAIEQCLDKHAIENLILIPHRDLHRFPLPYLFDNFTCTHLPSAGYYLSKHQPHKEKRTGGDFYSQLSPLLIVENPKSTPQINDKAKFLAPLPFAEVEAALICQMFPDNTRIENQAATYTQLQQALTQPHQVFHFTGHGAYNSNNPVQSCLFLSGTDRFNLRDIIGLDLRDYQLVNLAACETAVTGDQTITDEYVGLVSAFLKAGVTYIISTLWTVESAASTLLMVEFYQQLQGGKPPAAALKTAQTWLKNATCDQLIKWLDAAILKLREYPALSLVLEDQRDLIATMENTAQPYRHPYYWAAFTIFGV
ncbi:MAG: tetratricopeptide repeat protein [Xenococcaceae cyanobacterium]